jgi:hypothetical protein
MKSEIYGDDVYVLQQHTQESFEISMRKKS